VNFYTFPAYIKPVALPTLFDVGKPFAATSGTASGWGALVNGESKIYICPFISWQHTHILMHLFPAGGGMSNNLMWARFNIISNSVCDKTFEDDIILSKMCNSGAGGKSTCPVRFFSTYLLYLKVHEKPAFSEKSRVIGLNLI